MSSSAKNKFIQVLRSELPFLKKEYSLKSVRVFGSYIKDRETSSSDLDLLVTFDEVPGFFKFIQLENYLSDKLGIKVDLVMEGALKENIGESIKEEAIAV